jgi:hypothetical protein
MNLICRLFPPSCYPEVGSVVQDGPTCRDMPGTYPEKLGTPTPPSYIFKTLHIILTSLKSMLSEGRLTPKYQHVRRRKMRTNCL